MKITTLCFAILLATVKILFASNANIKVPCIVNKLIVTKVGVDSISASFYDNGKCGDYKISVKGTGSISIIPDNATVNLDYADVDPFSSSKIRSITATDKDIIFNFDYNPQLSKYGKDTFTTVLITPSKRYLAIENKPLNYVEEVNCDKSLGIINIKTTYATKINYGGFSKLSSYLDLYDTSLLKNIMKTSGCGGALDYRYEKSPARLRLIFNSESYGNLSAYHKDERSIVMTKFPKDNQIYVVKFFTDKDNDTDVINVVTSSGVVTKVDKLSGTEYAVEIDDNINKIGNVRYERRFSNSFITSISRQRVGKGDRFLVRVEKGAVLTVDKTESGFRLTSYKVFSE